MIPLFRNLGERLYHGSFMTAILYLISLVCLSFIIPIYYGSRNLSTFLVLLTLILGMTTLHLLIAVAFDSLCQTVFGFVKTQERLDELKNLEKSYQLACAKERRKSL